MVSSKVASKDASDNSYLPYARQWLNEEDIDAVVDVLRSDWLTTGPKVEEFESAVASYVGVTAGVAVNSGTAALHCAVQALGVGPGDEVIVPAMTFVATANCVVYQGATPVFADVDPQTLLIDPKSVESLITPHTVAIIAVDYAGQPCDYRSLQQLAARYNIALIADAAHSLGAKYREQSVGQLADITTFSFHPVKSVTTGEGGMLVTDNQDYIERSRRFRNHGIDLDQNERKRKGECLYSVDGIGYNYRLSDIQCALGISQLTRLPAWLARRREIAQRYDAAFATLSSIGLLETSDEVDHAHHLYVINVKNREKRDLYLSHLRACKIGANVHYRAVHLHPFYIEQFGTTIGQCPVAEAASESIISLPMSPRMSDNDVDRVIEAVSEIYEI